MVIYAWSGSGLVPNGKSWSTHSMYQTILNLHIVCFAAFYCVALAVEFARLGRRKTPTWTTISAFSIWFMLHTAHLWARKAANSSSPLSSPYDWYLLAACGGRRFAYLTVTTFVFLVISLVVTMFVDTQHSLNALAAKVLYFSINPGDVRLAAGRGLSP